MHHRMIFCSLCRVLALLCLSHVLQAQTVALKDTMLHDSLWSIGLDAVEIKGHKQSLKTPNVSHYLDNDDLDKLKGLSLGQILRQVPGVSTLQTGATITKPMINGMHSNRIVLLNNDIRQEGQQWGAEHAPEIDPFIANTITVVKGAETVRFGSDAVGGVVLIEPKSLPQDSLIHAEVNMMAASNGRAGTLSSNLSGNSAKIPYFAWRILGTLKQSGNYKTSEYYMNNTGMNEANYAGTLKYNRQHFDAEVYYSRFNTQLGIFQGAHIGSIEDLQARIANGKPFSEGQFEYKIEAPRQKVIHDLLKAKIHVHINDFAHLNVKYGFQNDERREFDIRRGGRTALPALHLSLQTHTLDVTLDHYNGKELKYFVGIQLLSQQNKSIPGTFVNPILPNFAAQGIGAFAVSKWLENTYEIEVGLRYDYRYLKAVGYNNKIEEYYGGEHHFGNLTGNIGAVWHLSNRLNIRSNAGVTWRPPTANELYSNGLHHGSAAIQNGDSTLSPENSLKWLSNISFQNAKGWLFFNIDAYVHYFNNYIFLRPAGSFQSSMRGAFPVFNYKQSKAWFAGWDANAKVDLGQYFDYTIKASFIYAKDITNKNYLPYIPPAKWENVITTTIDKIGTWTNNYLEIQHQFVAKQGRYIEGDDFAPPPPAYSIFNIGVGSTKKWHKHELKMHFFIENITNQLYKDYLNRFRYYAHEIGRNYVLRIAYKI